MSVAEDRSAIERSPTHIIPLINIQVRIHVSLVCAPDGAGHARPRLLDGQHALDIVAVQLLAGHGVDDGGLDAEEGQRAGPWLGRRDACERREDVAPGFRLPVCLGGLVYVYKTSNPNFMILKLGSPMGSKYNILILTSIIWHSSLPIISKYHFHTSAAMGSPTDASTRRCFILALTCWSPARLSRRRAVGAT